MARLARRSAGAEVSASAEQLSDTTLDYEAEAFAEIDSTYAEIAETIAALLAAAPTVAPSAPVWDEVAALVAAAGFSAALVAARLFGRSTTSASEALAAQLAAVEATMSGRYAGTAAVALGSVAVEDAVTAARSAFDDAVDHIVARSLADIDTVATQWDTGGNGDRDDLVRQLTSDRPVRTGGRGVVRRPAAQLRSAARAQSVGATNDVTQAGLGTFNTEARRRGHDGDPIRKQVLAHIDSNTTVVCLHAAGQIRDIDDPFDTIAGDFQRPPFHWGCRSLVIPWAPGMIQPHRDAANAELKARPEEERRIGPDGEIGGRIPGSPDDRDPLGVDELPEDFVDDPDLDLDDLPVELRLPYMRAHPERFSIYASGTDSWWFTDSGGTRWNLRK